MEFIEDVELKTWHQTEVKISKENNKGKNESQESKSQKH